MKVDIVIAGGGVAACAAAYALSSVCDVTIAVIEAHPPSAAAFRPGNSDSGISDSSNSDSSHSDTNQEHTDAMHPSFDARVIALAKASD